MRNLVRKIPHIWFGSDQLTGYWRRPGTPIFSPVNEERGEKEFSSLGFPEEGQWKNMDRTSNSSGARWRDSVEKGVF